MAKSKWLQEVEEDAQRIQTRRFKEHFEELEYQKEKKAKAQADADKKVKEAK